MTNTHDKQLSAQILKKTIARGDRFFVVHQRTSSSGMTRWYKVYAPIECTGGHGINDVTWYVAQVLGEKLSKEDSLKVKGCGFNAYDHLMQGLATDLGMDTAIKFDKG